MKAMIKTIKTIAYLIISLFVLTIYSCVPENNTIERTPELEAAELQNILTKLVNNGYDIDTTANGVYYIMREIGNGPTVKTGDTCFVEYAGSLPDGSIFTSSGNDSDNGIVEFVYPDEDMIPGFEEGLTVMNKGSKVDMIIPSSMAYGELGTLYVPPYTTVIITTKLDDLKPAPVE